jgi:hypothetical protein
MNIYERFWSHVNTHNEDEDECWEWTASRDKDGYGQFSIDGGKKTVKAHRFVLELNEGKLNQDELACHICDNPSCCNPYHIYKGSRSDNMRDAFSRGRKNHNGSNNPPSKLTEQDVITIRTMYLEGYIQGCIAGRFGVSQAQISLIVNRKEWKLVK